MKEAIKSMNWKYLLRESALILLLSYFFLLASTHNGLVSFNIFAITIFIFLVFEIVWLIKGQKVSLKKEIPIMVFLGTLLVASWFSIDPRRSITEVWLLGTALFLFLLTSDLVSRGWSVDLWVKALLVVGGIVMIFTWREAIVWYQQWYDFTGKLIPEISYRLPAPNFLAVFLNLLLMVAAASILYTKSKGGKVLLVLWSLSALGLIFLTSSRGGWLGTIAGLGSLFLLAAWAFPEQRKVVIKWLHKHRLVMILLVIGALTIVLVFAWVFIQQSNQPTHSKLSESRGFLWKPAWQAFLRSPIIGSGPYTYASFYLQTRSIPPAPLYLFSHNIYLDMLSGAGVVGLLAFLGAIICLCVGLVKQFRSTTGLDRGMVMGAMAALSAFMVHGVVDSVHHTIPTVAWVLAIILGVGIQNSQSVEKRRLGFSWWLGVALVSAGVLNLWAEKPLHEVAIAGNSGYWQNARQGIQEVIERDPALAIAYQQAGLIEGKLAEDEGTEAVNAALGNFETAIEIDPYWGVNYLNLGVLYREIGNLQQSIRMLEKAVEISSECALFQLNLGVAYEMIGDDDQAKEAYSLALEAQPLWQNAYFWRETSFRKEIHAQNSASAEMLMLSREELEVEYLKKPSGIRAYLNIIPYYLSDGDLLKAEEALRYAELSYTELESDRLLTKWYKAELAARRGDYGEAARLGDEALQRFMQQGVYGPGTFGTLMYDQLVFRRPVIMMEVVPQIEMIVLPDEWGVRLQQTAVWYEKSGNSDRAQALKKILHEQIPDYAEILDRRID